MTIQSIYLSRQGKMSSALSPFIYVVLLLCLWSQNIDCQGLITRGCKKDMIVKVRTGATMIGVPHLSLGRREHVQCLLLCRSERRFHCFGVEYHATTGECRLMKNGTGSETGWQPATLWFHFERYCLHVKAYTRIGGLMGPIAIRMGTADFMTCSNMLWTRKAARATCNSFGLKDGIPVTHECQMPLELSLRVPENRSFQKISCTGHEPSLLDCRGELDGKPCPGDKYASVVCFTKRLVQDQHEMSLRLRMYHNKSDDQPVWGMVQVRHLSHWAGVCEITDREARTICKQLGHRDGVALFASRWARPTADFGVKEPRFSLRRMICPDDATNIQSCGFDNTCRLTPYCHTNGFAHVLCTKMEDFNGNLQLTDGNEYSGRVELKFDGTWGTILSNENWTPAEATIACKQLGFKYGVPKAVLIPSSKPVWMSDVYCHGNETKITRCRLARGWHNPHPLSLAARRDAGVTCGNMLQFRLTGDQQANKGRVEVAIHGTGYKGSICRDLWGDLETKVLCRQLGYQWGGKVLTNQTFGRGSGVFLLDGVKCLGTETNVLSCKHKPFGVQSCKDYRDLTVECHQQRNSAEQGASGGNPVLPGDGEFFFTQFPKNIDTEVGSTDVFIQCRTSKLARIVWLANGNEITQSESRTGYQLHRGGVLQIRNIQPKHVGLYTCEAHRLGHGNHVIRAHAHVKLSNFNEGNCERYLDETPRNKTSRLGSTVLFKCFAAIANISWYKDGAPVVQDGRREVLVNGFLKIRQATRQDAGTYMCKANIHMAGSVCLALVTAHLVVFRELSEVCGQPIVQPVTNASQEGTRGYVIAGREARPGSAPWQVMITLKNKGWQPVCGGSIIHESLVVTAAHCVQGRIQNEADIKIKVGKHLRDIGRRDPSEALHRIEQIMIHHDFDANNFDNDIAILRLRTPVTFSDYVLPICLGATEQLDQLVRPGSFGTLTGWGKLNNMGELPTALNEVRLPVVARDICRRTSYAFTENMFCAGFGRALHGDSCDGDSGGPFSVKDPSTGRWYIGGIVSWGSDSGCAIDGEYGYYTRMKNYVEWTRQHLAL